MKISQLICLVLLLALMPLSSASAMDNSDVVKFFTGFKVHGLHYLSYEAKDQSGVTSNGFKIGRAYLTAEKSVNDLVSSRITFDATQEQTGDFKVRLKYLYAEFELRNWGDLLIEPKVEFGLVHTPWLDFEEKVNIYRMQGTMPMERVGLYNSADLGVTFNALLGGKIGDRFQEKVTKAYPGKYGSLSLGLYNGGGYHAKETNENKVIQGRLTVRPLPEELPGLQFSYLGLYGKCNLAPLPGGFIPVWQTQAGMASFEHELITVSGQLFWGIGNQAGDFVDNGAYSRPLIGLSGFGEFHPDDHWKFFGRLDSFDPNTNIEKDGEVRLIGGGGYDFGKGNILLLDLENVQFEDPAIDPHNILKITMQVKY